MALIGAVLQTMFGSLSMSDRQAFNPRSWANAFRDASGNPVNVGVQQDAEEFVNVFLDKLETDLKTTPQEHLVSSLFTGTCVNQVRR